MTNYEEYRLRLPCSRMSRARWSRTRPCATSGLPSGKALALITLDNGRDHSGRTRSGLPR